MAEINASYFIKSSDFKLNPQKARKKGKNGKRKIFSH